MARRLVNVGQTPNSRDGDPLRTAFIKINGNFDEVFTPLEEIGLMTPLNGIYHIKGNLVSDDNRVLIDSTSGKLAVEAVPNEVNLSFEFKVNFDDTGNVTTLENLPRGWTWSKERNLITIVHNNPRTPKSITYWGLNDIGEYRLRTPTAGYPVVRPANNKSQFTLTLIATVAGAVNGTHALVSVVF